MATHDVFYPLLLAELPGCPLPLVKQTINRAARDFCRDSMAWQEDIDAVVLRPGVWRYELGLPSDAQIALVQTAKIGTRDLTPAIDARGAINWGAAQGEPSRYAVLPNWIEIAVDPTPIQAATLRLAAVLAPTLEAATLPDVLADRHFDAIAEGVKARLMAMANKTWSDPAGAQLAAAAFAKAKTDARIEAAYGRVIGSLSVTPRPFG